MLPAMRRRRTLVIVLSLLPALLAAALWARSYRRRDLLAWDATRAGASDTESRRLTCQVYSSWGRLCLLSYSRPDATETNPARPLSLQSGDRASTEPLSELARTQLVQAGLMNPGPLGFAYSQNVSPMTSGTHTWTAAVLPWWSVTLVALTLPAYLCYRAWHPRTVPTDAAAPDADVNQRPAGRRPPTAHTPSPLPSPGGRGR
jgi:hypothetical protein